MLDFVLVLLWYYRSHSQPLLADFGEAFSQRELWKVLLFAVVVVPAAGELEVRDVVLGSIAAGCWCEAGRNCGSNVHWLKNVGLSAGLLLASG